MEKQYTKESLIEEFKKINAKGWILELPKRQGNAGGAGNTLEDLLGIKENNFSLPDIGEWELKTHKVKSSALVTLLHHDPEPRGKSVITKYIVPNFGWPHQKAGKILPSGKVMPANEKSFRQTINAKRYSDRGFKVGVNYDTKKLNLDFDPLEISDSSQLQYKVMLSKRLKKPIEEIKIDPEYDPYWDFNTLDNSMDRKLKNTFLAEYKERKTEKGREVKYIRFYMLQDFSFQKFITLLNSKDAAFIDFDARTHKNHGVKFRIKKNLLPQLYEKSSIVVEDEEN